MAVAVMAVAAALPSRYNSRWDPMHDPPMHDAPFTRGTVVRSDVTDGCAHGLSFVPTLALALALASGWRLAAGPAHIVNI